jgi:hypothetical protein
MENSGEFAHQNFLTLVAEEAWLGAQVAAPTQHAWWW